MTLNEQINSITTISELQELQRLIQVRIKDTKSDLNNFMFNDGIDDFIYVVKYVDGSIYHFCKGKAAYQEYINSSNAVELVRKTKDLFPVWENLLKKEIA